MEPARNFTRAEYDARVAKTRVAMQKRGIELLICSDPSNMSWLTGYDGWSFYVHQCVLLGLDGDPVWYGRGQDANGARRTAYMSDADIIGYPDHYVQSEVRHPMDYLSERIVERGWDKLSIGVEMDNYWFSAKAYASLREHLPNAKFIDATGLVNWQRGGEVGDGARVHAHRGALRRAHARPDRRGGRAGPEEMRPGRRDLRREPALRSRDRRRRRLCRHRAAAALRRRRRGAAPDLGRLGAEVRRGHLLRDRRRLSPLSLPAVAHPLPRQAAPGVPRRRAGGARGAGGGPAWRRSPAT